MKIKQTLVKPIRSLGLLLVAAAIYTPINLTASNNKTTDTPKKEKKTLSLKKQKELNNQFLNAVKNNEAPETIKKLVKEGADVNVRNYRGRTALHKYVEVDNAGMVAWLIKHGANLLIKDKSGKTAEDLIKIDYFEIREIFKKDEKLKKPSKNEQPFDRFDDIRKTRERLEKEEHEKQQKEFNDKLKNPSKDEINLYADLFILFGENVKEMGSHFKILSLKYHPDKQQNLPGYENFKELYAILYTILVTGKEFIPSFLETPIEQESPKLNPQAIALKQNLESLLNEKSTPPSINLASGFPLTNAMVSVLFLINQLKENRLGLSSVYLPFFIQCATQNRELLDGTLKIFDTIENAYFNIILKKLKNAPLETRKKALTHIQNFKTNHPNLKTHPHIIALEKDIT